VVDALVSDATGYWGLPMTRSTRSVRIGGVAALIAGQEVGLARGGF